MQVQAREPEQPVAVQDLQGAQAAVVEVPVDQHLLPSEEADHRLMKISLTNRPLPVN